MRLPPSFTTVTALSKTIALILFLALPLGGFFVGLWYQQVLDGSSATSLPQMNFKSAKKVQQTSSSATPSALLNQVRPISELISYTIPDGWVEKVAPVEISIESPDYKREGLTVDKGILIIVRSYPLEKKSTLEEVCDTNGGLTNKTYTKIDGKDALSGYSSYEGFGQRTCVIIGESHWDFGVLAPNLNELTKRRKQVDAFFNSIRFK